MNKYVEEYISRRKQEIVEEEMMAKDAEKEGVLNKLKLGEREYRDQFPDEPDDNFPYYDSSRFMYYRYNAGEISDEDYAELLKYLPSYDKPVVESDKKMSGWYTFAIIMMIMGCIGGIIGGVAAESGWLAIGSVLGTLIFFSQIILLCRIEYNTRSNN